MMQQLLLIKKIWVLSAHIIRILSCFFSGQTSSNCTGLTGCVVDLFQELMRDSYFSWLVAAVSHRNNSGGNIKVGKVALLTKYPLDLAPKKNKDKRSNPSITSTNKGIVIIHQYHPEVIFCIDFIAGKCIPKYTYTSLKTSDSEIHSGKWFSVKSYT